MPQICIVTLANQLPICDILMSLLYDGVVCGMSCTRCVCVSAGYERFAAMRGDPLLCFLDRCGPAPVKSRSKTSGASGSGAGAGDEDDMDNMDDEGDDEGDDDSKKGGSQGAPEATEADAEEGLLPWPVPMDVNTRLRRLVAAYQRHQKKQEQQQVQKEAVCHQILVSFLS